MWGLKMNLKFFTLETSFLIQISSIRDTVITL